MLEHVCLQINHNNITCLSIKVDQGLPCICHHVSRMSGKPLYGPFLVPKHLLPYSITCRTFTRLAIEVLFIEAASRRNWILSWVESMKILMERWMLTRLQTNKQYFIFSVLDLIGISKSGVGKLVQRIRV